MILKPLLFTLVFSATTLLGAAPDKDRHVILISLDGFPAWLWNDESLILTP